MLKTKKTKFSDETGEIYSEQEYFESNLILNDPNKPFVKLYNRRIDYSVKVYDAYFFHLSRFLEQNTNRIIRKEKIDGRAIHVALTRGDIEEELGISRTSTFRFLKESGNRHVIVNCRIRNYDKGFYINPLYALNGKGMSVELYLLFEHDPILQKALTQKDRNMIDEYLSITGEK